MKKIMLLVFFVAFILVGCGKEVSNNNAEKNENKDRYLTIINKTDQIINKITITVGEGTEIKTFKEPDFEKTPNLNVKIPKEYVEHNKVTVEFVDRYKNIYQKQISFKKKAERKEVVVSSKDKTKTGDGLSQIFNGN